MDTPAPRRLVSIVVPFFNEGEGVDAFARALQPVLDRLPVDVEIVCVDDGSRDDTLARLVRLHLADSRYRVLQLSRNFGKEAALSCGLDAARGDAVIPIDADLQDPPELMLEMIRRWQDGHPLVLARRADRSTDTAFKRSTAAWFYRLHNKVSDIEIPANVGDFRLMDRQVVEVLRRLPERQRFMKGLFAWVGFQPVFVDYERAPRAVGDSKFRGWKLWNFALEGITSFSTAPLRVWTYVGLATTAITAVYALFILVRTMIHGVDVPGYASTILVVLFFGSLQLISVGLLGEYIGRIYLETKQRPVYVVQREWSTSGGDAPR